MTTISKTYADIPFGHRQHKHKGHCAWIHGHNWSFTITFSAKQLDECGFVVDFGKLKWIKKWIEEKLDHSLLLNVDDPIFKRHGDVLEGYARLLAVPDCSCEGLAQWIYDALEKHLKSTADEELAHAVHTRGLHIVSVQLFEDARNSATFTKS